MFKDRDDVYKSDVIGWDEENSLYKVNLREHGHLITKITPGREQQDHDIDIEHLSIRTEEPSIFSFRNLRFLWSEKRKKNGLVISEYGYHTTECAIGSTAFGYECIKTAYVRVPILGAYLGNFFAREVAEIEIPSVTSVKQVHGSTSLTIVGSNIRENMTGKHFIKEVCPMLRIEFQNGIQYEEFLKKLRLIESFHALVTGCYIPTYDVEISSFSHEQSVEMKRSGDYTDLFSLVTSPEPGSDHAREGQTVHDALLSTKTRSDIERIASDLLIWLNQDDLLEVSDHFIRSMTWGSWVGGSELESCMKIIESLPMQFESTTDPEELKLICEAAVQASNMTSITGDRVAGVINSMKNASISERMDLIIEKNDGYIKAIGLDPLCLKKHSRKAIKLRGKSAHGGISVFKDKDFGDAFRAARILGSIELSSRLNMTHEEMVNPKSRNLFPIMR